MAIDDDLDEAPDSVREAAAWLEASRSTVQIRIVAIVLTLFWGLAGTGILHDVVGWSSGASGAVLMAGVVLAVLQAYLLARGPMRHVAVYQGRIDRYRALRDIGVRAEAPVEDALASDRLVARVVALAAERPEVVRAAEAAARRARRLHEEGGHLREAMEADPELSGRLAGVLDRVEAERAGIRAGLAETYAALVELDGARTGASEATVALAEAVGSLQADLEVEAAMARSRRVHQARTQKA